MIGFKTSYCKKKRRKKGGKLNFFTHVLPSSPQDRSSLCKISTYGWRMGDFQAYAVCHFWAILLSAAVVGVAV